MVKRVVSKVDVAWHHHPVRKCWDVWSAPWMKPIVLYIDCSIVPMTRNGSVREVAYCSKLGVKANLNREVLCVTSNLQRLLADRKT